MVNYEVGDRNNHPKYGLGKVISKQGSGPAERLVIDYGPGVGRMTFMAIGLPGDKL